MCDLSKRRCEFKQVIQLILRTHVVHESKLNVFEAMCEGVGFPSTRTRHFNRGSLYLIHGIGCRTHGSLVCKENCFRVDSTRIEEIQDFKNAILTTVLDAVEGFLRKIDHFNFFTILVVECRRGILLELLLLQFEFLLNREIAMQQMHIILLVRVECLLDFLAFACE